MVDPRKVFGASGEDAAVWELTRRGYRILARNVRTRVGELDVVARDGDTLCFIEIKARHSLAFGLPQEAVTPRKQRHIIRAAQWYLKAHRLTSAPARFDVVALLLGPDDRPTSVALIQNAFDVPGR